MANLKSKEHLSVLIICFICFFLFFLFALIGMMGGFKFLDQSTLDPSDPNYNQGQCCTECVESPGKFFSFVFLVPLAVFVVCMSITFYVFGIEQMKKAGGDVFDAAKGRAGSAAKSVRELKAAQYLFAIGFFVFALVAVILTFTSGKGLYSTSDYKNNNPTPAPGSCNGKWCVACKPEFWRLFLSSAGAGFGVWVIATGLLIASKKHAQSSAAAASQYYL
jgi:hypothetical protein